MTTGFIMSTLICVISMEFLPLSHRCSSMRNVSSGEERGETCFRRLMCQWLLQSPNRVLACRIGYKFLGNINRALIKICFLLVNLEPENGETGLHLAACKNNEKMISFLLDLGCKSKHGRLERAESCHASSGVWPCPGTDSFNRGRYRFDK